MVKKWSNNFGLLLSLAIKSNFIYLIKIIMSHLTDFFLLRLGKIMVKIILGCCLSLETVEIRLFIGLMRFRIKEWILKMNLWVFIAILNLFLLWRVLLWKWSSLELIILWYIRIILLRRGIGFFETVLISL
jgi:hypothetical protein